MTTHIEISNEINGFCLINLLNDTECNELITKVESLNMRPVNATENYRKMNHTMFEDKQLVNKIWTRIEKYLPSKLLIKEDNINIYGKSFCSLGEWKLIDLNSMWRCGKYNQNGLFAAHRDGFYSPTLDNRSFYTFMIYLNEDFEGGTTKFLLDDLCGVTKEVEINIKRGMAIIFPHNYLHEGTIITDGQKYILRSDVMYQKIEKPIDSQIQAYELYKLAIESESNDPKSAVSLYRQAMKICPEIEKYL